MKKNLAYVLLLGLFLSLGSLTMLPEVTLAASLYENYTTGDDANSVIDSSSKLLAQTFTAASSHSVSSVRVKLSRVKFPGMVTVSLKKTNAAGHPTGSNLTSGTLDGDSLTTNATSEWREIVFSNPYALFGGVKYAIVISAPATDPTNNKLRWRRVNNSTYAGGNIEISNDNGGNWTHSLVQDAMFEVWGNAISEVWVDDDWVSADPGDHVGEHIFGYDAFASIQDGIDAVTGSTVHVAAGNYTPSSTILANKSGLLLEGPQANVDPRPSAGSSRSAGSAAEAVVDGSAGNLGTIIEIDADNMTINGFEVKCGTADLIHQGNAHNGTTVKYCIIHDGNGDDGAQLKQSTNGLLEYNYVFDIAEPGDALSIADESSGGKIRYNEAHDITTRNAAIHIYGSDNMEVVGNLVYGVIESTKLKGSGIRIGNKNGSDYSRSGGLIQDNIIYDVAGSGIQVLTSHVTVEGNDISNCTSEDGAIFINYNVTDIVIRSNSVHDNVLSTSTRLTSAGILVDSRVDVANLVVAFNSIYNNEPYGLTNECTASLDATNNWWGANDGPNASPGSGDSVYGNVDYDPWVVVGISADPSSIHIGGNTSNITADMTRNSDDEDTSSQGHIPDGTQIIFTTTGGSIGSLQTTKSTVDGQANATLTSPDTAGAATVSAKAPGHEVQSTVSIVVNFYAEADLAISKSGSSDAVVAGTDLTYTVTVTNNGPDDATGVVVIDNLPTDSIGSIIVGTPSLGSASQSGGVVTWNVGNLSSGSSTTLTITVILKSSAIGTITNTATISGLESDPITGDNTATQETEVSPPGAVPGISFWGSVALVLLFGILLVWTIRRKNATLSIGQPSQ